MQLDSDGPLSLEPQPIFKSVADSGWPEQFRFSQEDRQGSTTYKGGVCGALQASSGTARVYAETRVAQR